MIHNTTQSNQGNPQRSTSLHELRMRVQRNNDNLVARREDRVLRLGKKVLRMALHEQPSVSAMSLAEMSSKIKRNDIVLTKRRDSREARRLHRLDRFRRSPARVRPTSTLASPKVVKLEAKITRHQIVKKEMTQIDTRPPTTTTPSYPMPSSQNGVYKRHIETASSARGAAALYNQHVYNAVELDPRHHLLNFRSGEEVGGSPPPRLCSNKCGWELSTRRKGKTCGRKGCTAAHPKVAGKAVEMEKKNSSSSSSAMDISDADDDGDADDKEDDEEEEPQQPTQTNQQRV